MKEQFMKFGGMVLAIAVGIIVANNIIQPLINKATTSTPKATA